NRTAMFVSHCHIDHMGLLGWIDPAVPIRAAEETARMVAALEAAGQPLEGGSPGIVAVPEGEAVEVGPLRVERWAVDHDVPGASGYLIHTDDGLVAYTGDLRLHGRHPERSERFAALARQAVALVVEGTTLSGDPRSAPPSEAAVDRSYDGALGSTPGLVLQSVYPRDVERVEAFMAIAQAHQRQILWPLPVARFLSAYGVRGVRTIERETLDEVASAPSRWVVQVAVDALDQLLGLPLGPGSVFVHANGEPLGPFQPTWDLLQRWLNHLHVPFRSIGTSGHATPDDLHRLVDMIAPASVYPVHTADPYHLLPPPGTRRVLPEYGRWYGVAARAGVVPPGRAGLVPAVGDASVGRDASAAGDASAPGDASAVGGASPAAGLSARPHRPIVCVDLDSTLADTSHRHHLVLDGDDRDRTDWLAYSMACAGDSPIAGPCRLVGLLAGDHRIVVVSSRDGKARKLTEEWLEAQGIPYDELILGGGDGAPSDLHEFKIHHLRTLVEAGHQLDLVIDDLPGLPAAVAEAGLGVPVLTVRPPYG
ncbi:MAG: MBL fold metallo-hydrolase, partial [Acidimicrobiales bacterium]